MAKNPENKGKNLQKCGKKKSNPKKGNPDMLHRLEFLQNIAQLSSEYKLTSLSSIYGTAMKTLGKKSVYRIDPKIKRNFCRKCSTCLVPDKSCDVKIVEQVKEYSYVDCICKTCQTTRKYILNPNHKLWETNPPFILKIHEELESKKKSQKEIES